MQEIDPLIDLIEVFILLFSKSYKSCINTLLM